MPRNKKSNSTRQADLKNLVRGSTGASIAIEALKISLKPKESEEFALWLRKTYPFSPYFKHLHPKNAFKISGLKLGYTQGFDEEFLWALGIIRAEKSSLMVYVSQRRSLESALEIGDFERALSRLCEITKSVGWSHHALGTMCYLIGQTKGLEAQKDWIEKNIFFRTTAPISFFAYWMGVRAEPGADASVFEASLKSYIRRIDNAEEEVFLEHILLGAAAPEEHEATLLRQLQSQSLVDLYEGMVVQAMAAASDFRSTSKKYFNEFVPLMHELEDGRYIRISAAMGDRQAFKKIYSDKIGWSPSREINFAGRMTPELADCSPNNFRELLSSIGDTKTNEKVLKARLAKHTYSSLWSRLSQFAGTAHRLRTATSIDDILFQYRLRFLHDDGFDPFLLSVLHPKIVKEHLEELSDHESPERETSFQLGRALVHRDFSSIQEICAEIQKISGAENAELLRIEIVSYLEQGSFRLLVQRLYPLVAASSDIIPLLPYTKISDSLTDSVISEIGHHPETAVLLARIVPFTGEHTRSQLIYAIETYLDTIGVDRASDIDDKTLINHPAARQLVLLGCQMETLALSLNFADGEEIQEERILELKRLADVDISLKDFCESEIEEIIRSQEIANAIDKLKTGKIDCDENQILSWARDKLKGKFERFRSFVAAGILPTTPGLANELLVAIREGASSSPVFEVPSNEAISIIEEIVNELISAYSFDPVYGLNSYLSLRVRHGTVSGQLRRSWTEERLLTTADSNGQGYEFNEHWFEILRGVIPVDQAGLIAEALADFSRSFDVAIAKLTDERIQILSKTKPDGVISTGFAEVIKLSFYDEAVNLEDFDSFLAAFSSLFWSNLETTLEGTRTYLGTTFRDQLNELFDGIDLKISSITSEARTPPLSDAIVRARLATNQSIDEMLEWFRGARPADTDPFPINDLARISLDIVKRLNPGFDPELSVIGETDFVAVSALFTFTDVFFVLFDNAQKHSGFQRPEISINVETDATDLLRIVVRSDCRNISRALLDAEKANTMISSGEYTSGLAAEGGTGLAKLAKIVERSKSHQPLSVSVDEAAKKFVVAMEFSFVNLGDKKSVGELIE